MLIKVNKNYFYTKDEVTISYVKEWSSRIAQIEKDNERIINDGREDIAEFIEYMLGNLRDEIIKVLNENDMVMPLPIIINK